MKGFQVKVGNASSGERVFYETCSFPVFVSQHISTSYETTRGETGYVIDIRFSIDMKSLQNKDFQCTCSSPRPQPTD